jgi:hypothetical protein
VAGPRRRGGGDDVPAKPAGDGLQFGLVFGSRRWQSSSQNDERLSSHPTTPKVRRDAPPRKPDNARSMSKRPSVVAVVLRLEGAAGLVVALLLYGRHEASWILFVVLLLTPDLSFAAYLAGPRIGSIVYNAVHTYIGPAILAAVGVVAEIDLAQSLALIWLAHISMDRLFGYGLKYETAFKDTHLQRV